MRICVRIAVVSLWAACLLQVTAYAADTKAPLIDVWNLSGSNEIAAATVEVKGLARDQGILGDPANNDTFTASGIQTVTLNGQVLFKGIKNARVQTYKIDTKVQLPKIGTTYKITIVATDWVNLRTEKKLLVKRTK